MQLGNFVSFSGPVNKLVRDTGVPGFQRREARFVCSVPEWSVYPYSLKKLVYVLCGLSWKSACLTSLSDNRVFDNQL